MERQLDNRAAFKFLFLSKINTPDPPIQSLNSVVHNLGLLDAMEKYMVVFI
jgi:hypothetical protein